MAASIAGYIAAKSMVLYTAFMHYGTRSQKPDTVAPAGLYLVEKKLKKPAWVYSCKTVKLMTWKLN